MSQSITKRHRIRDAIFLDIPYILDSVSRHADYELNRLHQYTVTDKGGSTPTPRPHYLLPPFWFFVLVLLFASYGATLSALCGVFGANMVAALRYGFGVVCIASAFVIAILAFRYFRGRIKKRFRKQEVDDSLRMAIVYIVLFLALLPFPILIFYFGTYLIDPIAFDTCRPGTQQWSTWLQLALFLFAAVFAGFSTRRMQSTQRRICWQVLSLATVVAILWFLPDPSSRTEAAQVPYRHVYAVIAVGMAAIAFVSNWLVRMPFFSMTDDERKPFRDALTRREIFPESRRDPILSPRRILGGGVLGVLHKPLQFLLLPAFAIILVRSEFIWHACILGTVASVFLITVSTLTSRWDQMSQYLRRYFLLGTPLVVSIGVVIIAAFRLADFQYVATVLNVTPFGVLFVWMIMAYVLAWWFEYQVNSMLAAKLLEIFDGDGSSDLQVIPYVPACDFEAGKSRVEGTQRYVVAHATGQFVTLGWFLENETKEPIRAFNALEFVELFSTLMGENNPDAAHEIGRRVQLYFASINVALIVGFGALLWHSGHGESTNTVEPVVVAQHASGNKNIELANLLHTDDRNLSGPAIVVAASGGGTRAALYTATVLQGLHSLQADRHVVLLSGVSGGGVAAAYFYGHRETLLAGKAERCDALDDRVQSPWHCYLNRMTVPFIGDVMQGAGEWRMQSEQPLGVLLSESFSRRLFADGHRFIGDDNSMGLILNTAITAHPADDSPMMKGAFARHDPSPDEACEDAELPVSALGGGRLAFSNLRSISAFTKWNEEAPNIQLPFVVVQDDRVQLADAAALNANFPPIFPSARVELKESHPNSSGCMIRSYYVTDGGAVENLGLVSALLALKSALTEHEVKPPLRDIDIVLAEASALDFDYDPDRGLGAATGQSKERLTGRLTLELIDQVRQAAQKIDPNARVSIYDLSLPRIFRSRGGFGTHWMFPVDISFFDPSVMPMPSFWKRYSSQYLHLRRFSVTLNKSELIDLWQGLFDLNNDSAIGGDFCTRKWDKDPHKDLTTVSNWICGHTNDGKSSVAADGTPDTWKRLKESLKDRSAP